MQRTTAITTCSGLPAAEPFGCHDAVGVNPSRAVGVLFVGVCLGGCGSAPVAPIHPAGTSPPSPAVVGIAPGLVEHNPTAAAFLQVIQVGQTLSGTWTFYEYDPSGFDHVSQGTWPVTGFVQGTQIQLTFNGTKTDLGIGADPGCDHQHVAGERRTVLECEAVTQSSPSTAAVLFSRWTVTPNFSMLDFRMAPPGASSCMFIRCCPRCTTCTSQLWVRRPRAASRPSRPPPMTAARALRWACAMMPLQSSILRNPNTPCFRRSPVSRTPGIGGINVRLPVKSLS